MLIIKVGGGRNINWDYIARDLAATDKKAIIVHGANVLMGKISKKLGASEKIITSPSGFVSRYTDEKTIEVLTMVYSGLANKKIVACLQKHGIDAVGLTGADGRLWLGKKKDAILSQEGKRVKLIRDSLNGKVESINTKLVGLLLANGFVPVVTIPAITPSGELINVDNDRAVAVMVKDLKVRKVVMLFEAPGLLKDPKDEASRIKFLDKKNLDIYLQKTDGRMRKKMLGVKEAFLYGAKVVYFGDGRIKSPISSALSGKGTVIRDKI